MPNTAQNDPNTTVNFVRLIGTVEREPQLHRTEKGTAASFSVRTQELVVYSSGRQGRMLESHRVVIFGKEAEEAAKILVVGQEVCVEGRLQTRRWVDKRGVARWSTQIVAQTAALTKAG